MNEISTGAKIEGSAESSDRETMRTLIDKGVEYLMPLYVDVHGIAKTKTVPVSHFDRMMRGSELFTGVCQLKVITFGFSIAPDVTRTTQPGSTSHFALFNFTSLFMIAPLDLYR